MAADTAAALLEEGERLVSEIAALEGQPDTGPQLLVLYLRLGGVVERCEDALDEVRP